MSTLLLYAVKDINSRLAVKKSFSYLNEIILIFNLTPIKLNSADL